MTSRTLYRWLCAVLLFQGVTALVAATTAWSELLDTPVPFAAFALSQTAVVVAVSLRYITPSADLRAIAIGGAAAVGAHVWLGAASAAGPTLLEQLVRALVWVLVMLGMRGLWPRVARLEERERTELPAA
jgi:hypothetical protein